MAAERTRTRRGDVRDAALTLFAERGYHGTSMKDIAEAVGMRAPSLYNHVGAKQELLVEIVEATLVDLQRLHEEAVGSTRDVGVPSNKMNLIPAFGGRPVLTAPFGFRRNLSEMSVQIRNMRSSQMPVPVYSLQRAPSGGCDGTVPGDDLICAGG